MRSRADVEAIIEALKEQMRHQKASIVNVAGSEHPYKVLYGVSEIGNLMACMDGELYLLLVREVLARGGDVTPADSTDVN